MKRGESGICCVVGIDKPQGKTSHDVVNAVRRIFGERRVGHTGTLDPLATGVLAVCVGPATRLDAYMVSHDKTYEVRIAFGVATDTDDAQGAVVRTAPVPPEVYDRSFASDYVGALVGHHRQLPPAYSAIKQGGVKGYQAARSGNVIQLEPRDIEIYEAELLNLEEDSSVPCAWWDVCITVSKGTYIRSIARDVGAGLGSAAHVESLRRVRTGALDVEDCLSLDCLESQGLNAAIDPVFLLGFRMAFINDEQAEDVRNRRALKLSELDLFEAPHRCDDADCTPRRAARKSSLAASEGEYISLVFENELRAIYAAFLQQDQARPSCVFSQGVIRGKGL